MGKETGAVRLKAMLFSRMFKPLEVKLRSRCGLVAGEEICGEKNDVWGEVDDGRRRSGRRLRSQLNRSGRARTSQLFIVGA